MAAYYTLSDFIKACKAADPNRNPTYEMVWEAATEAAVEKFTCAQQLKAEISALIKVVNGCPAWKTKSQALDFLCAELRKLSAV